MKELYLVVSTNTPKQSFRVSKFESYDEAKELFDVAAKDSNNFSVHLLKAEVVDAAGVWKDVFGVF